MATSTDLEIHNFLKGIGIDENFSSGFSFDQILNELLTNRQSYLVQNSQPNTNQQSPPEGEHLATLSKTGSFANLRASMDILPASSPAQPSDSLSPTGPIVTPATGKNQPKPTTKAPPPKRIKKDLQGTFPASMPSQGTPVPGLGFPPTMPLVAPSPVRGTPVNPIPARPPLPSSLSTPLTSVPSPANPISPLGTPSISIPNPSSGSQPISPLGPTILNAPIPSPGTGSGENLVVANPSPANPNNQSANNLKTFIQFVYMVTKLRQPEMHNRIFTVNKIQEKHPSEMLRCLRDIIGPKNFELLKTEFVNRMK